MRAHGQMMGLPLIWGSLQELRYAVETGKPAMEKLDPKGTLAYLQERPDEAAIFARAMTAKAGVDIAAVLAAYDFTGFTRGRSAAVNGGPARLEPRPGQAICLIVTTGYQADHRPVSRPRSARSAHNRRRSEEPCRDAADPRRTVGRRLGKRAGPQQGPTCSR